MKNYDFRMYKIDDLPLLTEQHKKNIKEDIGTKLYSNQTQKDKFKQYLLKNVNKFKCPYCGDNLNLETSLELDHFIPINDENIDDLNNLVLACEKCNNPKRNFIPDNRTYPYGVQISEIYERDSLGRIFSKIKDPVFNNFAKKLKFDSKRQTFVYIKLLIKEILDSNIVLSPKERDLLNKIKDNVENYSSYYLLKK